MDGFVLQTALSANGHLMHLPSGDCIWNVLSALDIQPCLWTVSGIDPDKFGGVCCIMSKNMVIQWHSQDACVHTYFPLHELAT